MTSARLPHLSNASPTQNLVSCACDLGIVNATTSHNLYQDAFFGHTWTWTPNHGAAVYGRTEDLPITPIDHLCKGEFMRVPYRRIPVIDVGSFEELCDFATQSFSPDPSVKAVWRGQNSHYSLPRAPDELLRLYGDVNVSEPSLLPSAARSQVTFPDVFARWSALIDVYLTEHSNALIQIDPKRKSDIELDVRALRNSYNYRVWGLATAQHYGLPSVGLDVTDAIEVAAFFALHAFRFDPGTRISTITRVEKTAEPIIYALGAVKDDLIEDQVVAPSWLQSVRAVAQSAHFMPTGWGVAINKPATRLYVAYRLKHHTQWKLPIDPSQLFPVNRMDPFATFLRIANERFGSQIFTDLLRRVYYAD